MPRMDRKGALLLIEGLDVSKPADYLSDTASPSNQNFFVERAILRKRFGITTFGATMNNPIMAGREFVREGVRYNVRMSTTAIERYNTATSLWVDVTDTNFTGSASDSFDTCIAIQAGKQILCMTNGIDSVRKYTGTGNESDLSGAPKGKFIEDYKGYVVIANITGGTDVSQRVAWSHNADPENWTTGLSGETDLVEDGEDITGMKKYGDYLAVHKLSSIYLGRLVSNNNIFQFDRIPTEAGAVSNKTIQNLPTGEQAFVALDGIRVFNGRSAPHIEALINDEIRTSLNVEYMYNAWSVVVKEKDEVWFGLPIGSETTGSTVYKFNYKTRVAYKDTRQDMTAAWRFTSSSFVTWNDLSGSWNAQSGRWNDSSQQSLSPIIMLGDSSGLTYKVDSAVNSDNGEAVYAFWESKDFLIAHGNLIRWLELELWAKGGTVQIEYSTDSGNTWMELGQSPVTLTSFYPPDDSPLVLYFDVVASKIRFRFSNNGINETLFLKQFVIGYRPRERRY